MSVGQFPLTLHEHFFFASAPDRGQEAAAPSKLGVGDIGRAGLFDPARGAQGAHRLHHDRYRMPAGGD